MNERRSWSRRNFIASTSACFAAAAISPIYGNNITSQKHRKISTGNLLEYLQSTELPRLKLALLLQSRATSTNAQFTYSGLELLDEFSQSLPNTPIPSADIQRLHGVYFGYGLSRNGVHDIHLEAIDLFNLEAKNNIYAHAGELAIGGTLDKVENRVFAVELL